MARPIGAFFHVHHGTSIAMLLPAVTAYSAQAAPQRYAEAARAMGLAGSEASEAAAVERLVLELRHLNRDLGIPSPRAHGIDGARWTELLPTMASQALASGSPANNPRVPEAAEIVALYREMFG
ncbi:MAG TPA: iron-containing alcohol dehydrogenase, partial [Anaeromyxobacteraceae bacterium]